MRKEYLFKVFACMTLAASLAVSGCGNGSKDQNTKEISEEKNKNSATGMIQSVEENEITIATMKNGGGPGQKGENGQPPEKPRENGEKNASSKPDGAEQKSDSDGADQQEAPEKPDNHQNAENQDTAQSKDGTQPQGTPPEMPNGESGEGANADMETQTFSITTDTVIKDEEDNTIAAEDLQQGNMVTITYDDKNQAVTITISNQQNAGGGPGGSEQPSEYTAVNSYTEDTSVDGESISSSGTDENAVHVSNGAEVTLSDITVEKNSDDSTGGDSSSFYGVGAAALTTDGTLYVKNSKISTDSAGGAGVFAYGDGVAKVSDTTIVTKQDTSGGIHVAGGGTLEASNLTVETSGESSAAIRSDRGGGTMQVKGGTYTSNGTGSPAVYCTANIRVADATLTANGSEAVCIEGLNSLKLENCKVTSNMPENEQNDCVWSVILYQSMSGDSEVGNSTFSMKDGELVSKNGGLFYTTNTESTFTLENVKITAAEDSDFFLKCTGNSNARGWGETGKNGAQCKFTASNQNMPGDVIWDSISQLDLQIKNKSVLTGAIVQDESNAGSGGDGYANVTIDKTSKWVVTGDSTVSKLTCKGTIVDHNGKKVTIQDTDGTVLVKGGSSYTITVASYSEAE